MERRTRTEAQFPQHGEEGVRFPHGGVGTGPCWASRNLRQSEQVTGWGTHSTQGACGAHTTAKGRRSPGHSRALCGPLSTGRVGGRRGQGSPWPRQSAQPPQPAQPAQAPRCAFKSEPHGAN